MARERMARSAALMFVGFQCAYVLVANVDRLAPSRVPSFPALGVAYGDLTGALGDYRFFSPNIAEQPLAEVVLYREGREIDRGFFGDGGGEFNHRKTTLLNFFRKAGTPDLQSRCIAAYVLGRQPQADTATVNLGYLATPSMANYRRGERPRLVVLHAASFAR